MAAAELIDFPAESTERKASKPEQDMSRVGDARTKGHENRTGDGSDDSGQPENRSGKNKELKSGTEVHRAACE